MRESAEVKGRVGLSLSEELTTQNVGKLGLQQSWMKAALHTDIRKYIVYRTARSYGLKVKAPFSLTTLAKRQAEINKIRVKLGRQRIRLIQELKKTLKNY